MKLQPVFRISEKCAVILFVGMVLGFVLGTTAYSMGVGNACPKAGCVGSASITPVTDRAYFEAAKNLISSAGKSVHVVAFEIKYYSNFTGSTENQLVEELISARGRGVDVMVFVDDSFPENSAVDILRRNGVDVKVDDPDTTTHSKLIIVDGDKVLLGSTNLSYYSLEKNHETNLLVADSAVAGYFERYFRNLWGRG